MCIGYTITLLDQRRTERESMTIKIDLHFSIIIIYFDIQSTFIYAQ
jgi:hypothetical protein